ncbi:dynamin-2 [Trichonephila inaurata madagascariensis]|uniref:dynamin GTPase n=1 Tax=Trichonephila inaurata madagascariensis TaxID=2747483 RepID=A0A8X6XA03_9ARAC|nr:dynamin-2 [Trichonephila inaurata madagascariensis]
MFSTPRRTNMHPEFAVRGCKDEGDVVEMINKLQNKLASNGKLLEVSLPQIVVEGSQSSGKSSVLESIIGREFLPRGTGTVTRRPTIIQLYPSDEVYAEFLHKSNEKFTDFERVKQEIMDETMKDPGPNGFSSKPITLKIYAPNVLKLTFVDMPGCVKNVGSNISAESIEDLDRMILRFIEPSNSVILAVSPANQDIETSDALEMAYRVDPERKRTICVLTKLDLMDPGTDVKDVLENRVIPLAKGFVGVTNRSQKDIDEGKDIEYSRKNEKRFFENHPAYSHMADRQGSEYLQKMLHVELIEHIRRSLPAVRRELSQKLNSLRKDVKLLDQMMGFNKEGCNGVQVFMQKLVFIFIEDIQTKLIGHSESVCINDLKAGAIINFKIYSNLKEIMKMPTNLNYEEFVNLIANVHGIRNILSVPSIALEAACAKILEKYKIPIENLVDAIVDILILAVEESAALINDYPCLKEHVTRFIDESIDRASEECKIPCYYASAQMVSSLGSKSSESNVACSPVKVWSFEDDEDMEPTGLSSFSKFISVKMKENENAKGNSQILSDMIEKYISLVQKQIADTTYKYINVFLVHKVSDFIRKELIINLMNFSGKDIIMQECEQEFQRRNEMLDLCADIEEALAVVQSF